MKKHLFLIAASVLAVASALSGCHHISQARGSAEADVAEADTAPVTAARLAAARLWADSIVSTLNLRQQIGQLMFPRLDIRDDAAGRAALKRMVDTYGIGGYLLGAGTLADYKGIIDYGRSLSAIPLLVALDGEWGLAMRVTDAPRFPHAMALGAIKDPQLLVDYGREVARECELMGIHVNFAPVLDVNSNPSNPVIGFRSFGEDPERVSCMGVAYSRGLEEGGVMSVGKHFPGHGDTSVDSHKALPTVSHDSLTLAQVDLLPFRNYIHAGMSGIMVGHLSVPALDPSGAPASLSRIVTSGLLKGKMGFTGLVWTDALAMKGAGSNDNNCVRALEAGADVLLQPAAVANDLEAIEQAVASGRLSADIIRERCVKVLTYKHIFALTKPEPAAGSDSIRSAVCSSEADAINRKLSEAAVTLLQNSSDILPLGALTGKSIAVVSLGAKANNDFAAICSRYADCTLFGSADGSLTASQLKHISTHDIVIVGVFRQSAPVASSLAAIKARQSTIAACFINPYKMARMQKSFAHYTALLTAYDDTPRLESAAAQGIFGGIAMDGRLPVGLDGWFPLGAGLDTPKTRLGFATPAQVGLPAGLAQTYDRIINQAIRDGAFPGCQVVVAKNGFIVIDKAYGTLNPRGSVPVSNNTLYDVASVSKVAGTLAGLMRAYDQGLFALDDTLGRFIPDLRGTPQGRLTMRQLMLHRTGLPPMLSVQAMMTDAATYTAPLYRAKPGAPYTIQLDKNLYANSEARLRTDILSAKPTIALPNPIAQGIYGGQATYDSIMARIHRTPLRDPSYRYSDLNFALLAEALEQMKGDRLDHIVETEVFEPIGASRTMYTPLAKGVKRSDIAPTERDNFLRRQLLQGYVHDELAAFSGGVQGNAGLFSTASDLARLCQTWLQGGTYGGVQVFRPATINTFTRTRSDDGNRALGFDTSVPKSGKGSRASYGHLGFTGTQIKVDPEANLIFIFLSNRVNPSRLNPAFTRADVRGRLWAALFS